jgi:hypothetical protein
MPGEELRNKRNPALEMAGWNCRKIANRSVNVWFFRRRFWLQEQPLPLRQKNIAANRQTRISAIISEEIVGDGSVIETQLAEVDWCRNSTG